MFFHSRLAQPALPAVLLLLPLSAAAADIQITPPAVSLQGNFARAQLIVTAKGADGSVDERAADLTHRAAYASADERIVTVSATGQLVAVGNGQTSVTVTVEGVAKSVPVHVSSLVPAPAVDFTGQVMPILSKAGCNAGACHASQHGKGGFKLSVFGYAPNEDWFAIVRDGAGRRVTPVDPARSLLLLKPSASVPHGGGRRFPAGSVEYEMLRAWVACGAPGPKPNAPEVIGLSVWPARRVGPVGFTQQLRVTARISDGRERDVTALARFDGMSDGVLRVSPQGVLQTVGKGQGTVMVRYEGRSEIAQVVVPYADAVDLAGWVENNYIDRLAAAKFRQVGIAPSGLCDDATFLRRAYLDVTGTLPTVEQARAFLDSKDSDKRKLLVDELLGLTGDPAKDTHNDAYAAYWALKWSDLLRANSQTLGEQGMWALHNWLVAAFRENTPMDRFVRELVTARGATYDNGPANFYMAFGNADQLAEATAQIFLGVRVMCARCHHHPFEPISRRDHAELMSFFGQVRSKRSANYGRLGGPPVIVVGADGNPTPAKILNLPAGRPPGPAPDRRRVLADWITRRDNPYFARNLVNRYVAYLLGHGLVEPIDDLRGTNPASNSELLDALAGDFAHRRYNVKHLLRTVLNSRLYQLSAAPTPGNAADARFYSHYAVKRIAAEPLLDAIDQAAGVPTKFDKVPLGTRAIELPDAQYDNYFLKTFGKPKREGVCECERVSDPNLAQALHTLNSDVIAAKISNPKGRVAALLAVKKPMEQVVEELYLATLSRRPTAAEWEACQKLRAEAPDEKTYYEDLLWALVNSKQFLFVH